MAKHLKKTVINADDLICSKAKHVGESHKMGIHGGHQPIPLLSPVTHIFYGKHNFQIQFYCPNISSK